jgi:hypothetical protein
MSAAVFAPALHLCTALPRLRIVLTIKTLRGRSASAATVDATGDSDRAEVRHARATHICQRLTAL